jgi:hypothetical protein
MTKWKPIPRPEPWWGPREWSKYLKAEARASRRMRYYGVRLSEDDADALAKILNTRLRA